MTLEDYKKEYNRLIDEHNFAVKKLKVDFGLGLATFNIGDIIQSNDIILLIDRIKVDTSCFLGELPYPVYEGVVLKKDLTPRKDLSRGSIFATKTRVISLLKRKTTNETTK